MTSRSDVDGDVPTASPGSLAPLPAGHRLVAMVAEQMAVYQPRRRFRRAEPTINFVPAAREVVASMLFLPDNFSDCCEAVHDFMRRSTEKAAKRNPRERPS